jgi:hypothetical protein
LAGKEGKNPDINELTLLLRGDKYLNQAILDICNPKRLENL